MSEPVIRLHEVSRLYHEGEHVVHAVDGVSFELEPGAFAVLAGPSGSGKTTLLNLIGGLDQPTSGEVWVAGRRTNDLDDEALTELRRDHVGFVFQAYNLIPVLTAAENAELVLLFQGVPPAERRARVEQLFRELGLAGLEDRFPSALSGGQQQRVAVVRAVAAQPAIVLADEPTANLDSAAAERLIEMMERLNREYGTTFLFSSHDERVISRARRILRLRDGRLVADERQDP